MRASAAIPRSGAFGEAPEDEAEDGMAKRLLREDARAQERRQVLLAAARVLAVDERGERVESDVLGEREPECERPRAEARAAADGVEAEPEEGAVHGVEREAGGAPAAASRDELAEQCDVAIVRSEEPFVERLEQAPDGGGNCSGGRGASPVGHGEILPLRWPTCRKATRSTAPRVGCACSWASGSKSRRPIRAAG